MITPEYYKGWTPRNDIDKAVNGVYIILRLGAQKNYPVPVQEVCTECIQDNPSYLAKSVEWTKEYAKSFEQEEVKVEESDQPWDKQEKEEEEDELAKTIVANVEEKIVTEEEKIAAEQKRAEEERVVEEQRKQEARQAAQKIEEERSKRAEEERVEQEQRKKEARIAEVKKA